jgi:aminoglycoside phosphotransferase (APT) family kinase protein
VTKGDREMVLRRPPRGAAVKGGHDVLREARILAALAPVYARAPRVIALGQDVAVMDVPFFLMERVRGIIPRGPAAEALTPGERAEVSRSLVEALAELHGLDAGSGPLAALGHGGDYVERQVKGWTARWQAARTGEEEGLDEVARWLDEHRPGGGAVALVHNDFKHDNVVLDPGRRGRIRAVLDWEMATVGDPLMDLGTSLAYWVDPDDPPEWRRTRLVEVTTQPGSLRRREVAELYARLTGRDLSRIAFYYAFGLFKVAVIAQQIYARFRQGHTKDARFARLDLAVAACGAMAARVIAAGRIDGVSS